MTCPRCDREWIHVQQSMPTEGFEWIDEESEEEEEEQVVNPEE